jgi:Arc/MetJ family transcription regulator
MRTNVEVDEDLVEEAMRYSSTGTKRGLVAEALKTFVEVKAAERRRSSYVERLASLRTRTSGVRVRKSVTTILREDRRR